MGGREKTWKSSTGALPTQRVPRSRLCLKCRAHPVLRRRRGEPGSPPKEKVLLDGKFAAVAEAGLSIAHGIDGYVEDDVVAGWGIGRDLEGDFVDADQVG